MATGESAVTVAAGAEREFDQTVELAKPGLWSPDSPTLYRVHSLVQTGGAVVDRYETPFGIRDIAYDVDRGFLLNGVPLKLLCEKFEHTRFEPSGWSGNPKIGYSCGDGNSPPLN